MNGPVKDLARLFLPIACLTLAASPASATTTVQLGTATGGVGVYYNGSSPYRVDGISGMSL